MNSSWFTHEQFMVMNFRKAGLTVQTMKFDNFVFILRCRSVGGPCSWKSFARRR